MTTSRRREMVRSIIEGRSTRPASTGTAYAPANIALCKYWGKRDAELNLPVTSSLSISLGGLGTATRISALDAGEDAVLVGKDAVEAPAAFRDRVVRFLDLFRPAPDVRFRVHTVNSIPTGAGFASSASGFAALVLSLDALFGWKLDRPALSVLARLGSGSACRSLYDGFVEWSVGTREDGMDSHAHPVSETWPGLCIGLLPVRTTEKTVGSTRGMDHTSATSPLYAAWPATVERDLAQLREALRTRDFRLLGETAEANALAMHATMLAARPALLYWAPETVSALQAVQALRENGLPVYATMDAGPNPKLLFETPHEKSIRAAFPTIEIVRPFNDQVMTPEASGVFGG